MSEKTVFISYRRDMTGSLFARLIKQALTGFGYDVYLDVDNLKSGGFADQILVEVPRRSHFLLLLTPGSLDRCVHDRDWVRAEYLAAVKSNRNIVPVLEASANLSEIRRSCPDCMLSLFERQIAELRSAEFSHGIQALIERFIAPHHAPIEAAAESIQPVLDQLQPTTVERGTPDLRRSPNRRSLTVALLAATLLVSSVLFSLWYGSSPKDDKWGTGKDSIGPTEPPDRPDPTTSKPPEHPPVPPTQEPGPIGGIRTPPESNPRRMRVIVDTDGYAQRDGNARSAVETVDAGRRGTVLHVDEVNDRTELDLDPLAHEVRKIRVWVLSKSLAPDQ